MARRTLSEDTVYIKGEGGAVFEMALPLASPIQQRLDKGYLKRVNADGSPYREPEAEGSDLTSGEPSRPNLNAPKAEWVSYAVHALGLKPDDADGFTKQDLIDLAGADAPTKE